MGTDVVLKNKSKKNLLVKGGSRNDIPLLITWSCNKKTTYYFYCSSCYVFNCNKGRTKRRVTA
ncbi:MAG: hypothetical protein A3D31_18255 [Candidatus Fluviicola riflensis]|nr:MAG: hypothetical protein A3D31_18255 [Candidatus Fluviicola riflensis]OGS81850.1 MAG: hypothetical protein A2724_15655 [Fluviicola sp. RIFCSPHIGHO2_01_FULL_43_53]